MVIYVCVCVSVGSSVWRVAAGGGVFGRIKRRITDQATDRHDTAVHRETAHLTLTVASYTVHTVTLARINA